MIADAHSIPLWLLYDDEVDEWRAARTPFVKAFAEFLKLDTIALGVAVAELFLNPGQKVVSTKGRVPSANATYQAKDAQRWPNLPIVVLVNRNTASAARVALRGVPAFDEIERLRLNEFVSTE